ncbi:hypothetical protein KIL84_012265 [Mauremys mutica]|uniref:Uncharacterized protein n=1 Tax=Mauremys mutica TaxID=74926 RepID=A0A9D3XET7_9SAUR|nr:hypothetical protein KIL84_012265 [Mauremys mutica]
MWITCLKFICVHLFIEPLVRIMLTIIHGRGEKWIFSIHCSLHVLVTFGSKTGFQPIYHCGPQVENHSASPLPPNFPQSRMPSALHPETPPQSGTRIATLGARPSSWTPGPVVWGRQPDPATWGQVAGALGTWLGAERLVQVVGQARGTGSGAEPT